MLFRWQELIPNGTFLNLIVWVGGSALMAMIGYKRMRNIEMEGASEQSSEADP